MECACIHLNDLPYEILLIIFKKLTNAEILYSLMGVNKRFNKIVYDSTFTSSVTLLRRLYRNFISPLPLQILDRFCLQILPEIHHKIKWLNIESSSIERVLLATNYPNLSELGLYNLDLDKTKQLFTDESLLSHLFKSQIVSLAIDIAEKEKVNVTLNMTRHLFTQILTMFTNLQYLKLLPFSIGHQLLIFDMSSSTVFSSNLLELHLKLEHFTDCLYLLDGRFNQLHTLYVNISVIISSPLVINQEKLPNLKYFSLECGMVDNVYDELILSLLHRMSNLEQLNLYFVIFGRETFIDGNNLKNIINYMPQLNQFIFNIRSRISVTNQINLPSNEDIQYTFRDFKNNQIISYINYYPKEQNVQCHIYSYPYIWKDYTNISNSFSGGLFKCVREVLLFDEYPFEHEFFLRVSQSFPFLKSITVVNNNEQKNQRRRKLNDDNENLSIIQYLHLTRLDLLEAHDDYIEQFLLDTKTCLPNDVFLHINHERLKKITNDFKRDETRINCSKIRYYVH